MRGRSFFLLFILTALTILLPQAFFEVQDSLLNGRVNLDRMTPPDLLALETGYETSVYRRMANYAEGIDGQRRYYVDGQDRELPEDAREFAYELLDDTALDFFSVALGLTPEIFFIEGEISLWKQYVIYSDDYAQGVNFVLWCVTLEHPDGYRMTLLVDAHDHTVYAVRTTGMELSLDVTRGGYSVDSDGLYLYLSDGDICWAALNVYYGVLNGSDPLTDYFYAIEALRLSQAETEAASLEILDAASNGIRLMLSDDGCLADASDGEEFYARQINGSVYRLPYAGHKLNLDMLLEWTDLNGNAARQPEITVGIREIYELIPEFQHAG